MFRKMTLTACLIGSCLFCLVLVTRADSAQESASGDAFKPVASVDALMHGQLAFFKKIGKALKNADTPDRAEVIEDSAEVLAELANVNRYNNDKKDYRGWATQLRDDAMKLAHEAEKNGADDAKMNKLFEQMKATCTACHDVYQQEEE